MIHSQPICAKNAEDKYTFKPSKTKVNFCIPSIHGLENIFLTQSCQIFWPRYQVDMAECCLQVVPASLQTLQAFQSMRPSGITMRAQLHAMLDRALIKLAKLLRDTQEMHPW